MNNAGLRKQIMAQVKLKGRNIVCARLIEDDVAPSTADQLTRGKYPQEPTGDTRDKVVSVLEKLGRAKTAGEAS
jgi:hypothetical protein